MLSKHALERCQQRGIPLRVIETLLQEADIDLPAGGNCRFQRLSRKQARRTGLDPRLCRLGVVISDTTQQIVTVFHLTRRRYNA